MSRRASRRRRKQATKRERADWAAQGGSAVAREAYDRPGGTHGRRPTPRAAQTRRALNEQED